MTETFQRKKQLHLFSLARLDQCCVYLVSFLPTFCLVLIA